MNKKKPQKEPIVALDPVAYRELKKAEEADIIAASQQESKEGGSNSTASSLSDQSGVLGAILKSLKNHSETQVNRMSFEIDPKANYSGNYGFYRMKAGLTPDHIIKRITGPQGDELVCQILQARSNMIASFGRPRTDRFSTGFEIIDMDRDAKRSEEEQKEIQKRIDNAKKFLWKCGKDKLDDEVGEINLSQFFKMITRDGVSYGRFSVEKLWYTTTSGKKELYAFRASDAGTVYKILSQKSEDQSLRAEAVRMLSELKNEKIDVEKYKKDEYKYVQVIEGRPVQAFTAEEMVVYSLYPVTNVEYNGYPLTPIDQALNAITTHISITIHNKLYFQNGRAARGMLVFKSDTIDESSVQKIRLQFHQSINSAQNSWRMPVFAVGSEDDVSWQAIDQSGRDAEFQYLMDSNARVILSAFQMSPEELPGYAHLARGTNTQALSESDNEWKLTAARDVGLRPLIYDIQDFLNTHILPDIDPELAKTHKIVLTGLDKDSPEKEATRLLQDQSIHMTYNEILSTVEKNEVSKEVGGDFPLNPQFQQVISSYLTVGQILENFFGIKEASKDPRYQYVRDPFWFQNQQMLLQKAQIALQQQMMAQQMMQQQFMATQGQDQNPEGQENQEVPPEQSGTAKENMQKNLEWSAKNYMALEKTIKNNHNTISKAILKRHKEMVDKHLKSWKEESKNAIKGIEEALDDSGDDKE